MWCIECKFTAGGIFFGRIEPRGGSKANANELSVIKITSAHKLHGCNGAILGCSLLPPFFGRNCQLREKGDSEPSVDSMMAHNTYP